MEIKYNVQLPGKRSFGGIRSAEILAIIDFMSTSNARNMCMEYETSKEAETRMSTVLKHKRKYNAENKKAQYDAYRVKNCIYVVRETKTKAPPPSAVK